MHSWAKKEFRQVGILPQPFCKFSHERQSHGLQESAREGRKAEVDEETGEEEDAAKASSAAGSLQGLAEVRF